ncbi:MAG: peptidoglycan-binding protein, partial [Desulfuromonadales bacterium]|nr:peptidoglycan-binding protein [Desulfuromonadales bacterium]
SEEALVQAEPAPIIEKNTAQKAESALLIDQKAAQKAEPEPEAPFQPHPDSLIASCNALLALWDISPLASGVSSEGFDIDQQFSLRGFRIARLAGDFETLSKFNVPLLVPLPEERGGGYLAVLGQTSVGMWSIAPAYQGRETLSTSELNNLGLQMALVPWIDFSSIGYVAVPGVKGENVRRLQYLLGLAGCSGVSTSGRFDPSSIQCVKAFQRQNGLIVDGLVGPRTLILLYQVAGTYKMPRLS